MAFTFSIKCITFGIHSLYQLYYEAMLIVIHLVHPVSRLVYSDTKKQAFCTNCITRGMNCSTSQSKL